MNFTREQQDQLEAYGFDLMAQVEAMLRHVREYQRTLQRLRGTLPKPQSTDPNRTSLAEMIEHIRALREIMTQFDIALTDVEELTKDGFGA